MGIEPMASQIVVGHSNHWATRTHGELDHLIGSYVTRILHTARIRNVESL